MTLSIRSTRVAMFAIATLCASAANQGAAMPIEQEPHYDFTIYAEYSQFFLGDSGFNGDTASPDFWTEPALQRRLAIVPPSLIAVGTGRYDYVPVSVDVVSQVPSPETTGWNQIVEASIDIPSGRLVVDGPTLWDPGSSPEINLPPGTYRARVMYGALHVPESDYYSVILWRDAQYSPPLVVLAGN
ncbi:MAG: hypothetical protein JO020_00455 [Chloroflexi bacterium]|nr:hypothetical protein [Chloroflexota bacterium]